MNNKKTLIILTPGFPESESDSTCLPMQQSFIKTLKELYSDINIIILSFQHPYHKNVYTWFDIKVIPFNGRNKGGLAKILLRKKINSTLHKINKTNKIIGLLSFWSNECAWIGKKFGDNHGIKHYCWVLGQDAKKENKYPARLHFKPNELIALSDFLQNEFKKNHGVKPRFVVPPGIDEKLFESPPKEKDIDILGVGSLIPLKQYDIFLEVIAGIKKQIPAIKVLLAGKGPEKKKLESLITKSGLENNVRLTGELPYHEVLRLMQRAKIFLHPSSYEGFGCVCLEALFAGAHVISFCKPMNADISHWLIVKNKEEMNAAALKTLKSHRTGYSSIKLFTINDTVSTIMELFES
ncbi:MAG: glycosyltransferase family 4 protein [Chitinophagales bacterium]